VRKVHWERGAEKEEECVRERERDAGSEEQLEK
jgi:hypothetical protein